MTTFKLVNDRLLEVNLGEEKVMSKAGAMVAYNGKIKFEKSLLANEGIFGALKRKVSNESFNLMVSKGAGNVYFADQAREITIIQLSGEKLYVESSSILAYDSSLTTDTAFGGAQGAVAGQGLFTTTIQGNGNVAIISHGNLISLEVTPEQQLFVDPDAFIGYKGNLSREFHLDVGWKNLIGQASGESYQVKFSGTGTVFIQPSERR
jgi:uncharacterized protein (AIM24 family)